MVDFYGFHVGKYARQPWMRHGTNIAFFLFQSGVFNHGPPHLQKQGVNFVFENTTPPNMNECHLTVELHHYTCD